MGDLFLTYSRLADELLEKTYMPGLVETLQRPSATSWLLKNLKRRSDMVRGTRAFLHFMPQIGWGWRPVHPATGVFPSGGQPRLDEMSYRLAMYGAGIQLNLEELENLGENNPEAFVRLMNIKMKPVYDGFDSFLQVLVRTPQSGIVLVASAAESSLGVACDNSGLPNTVAADRMKWLEEGMYLQWYRGVREKVGGPVEITYVDRDNAIVYLDESRGVADNDFAVLTTPDGDEDMYYIASDDANAQEGCPGIYDVLSASNTFQGIDRSQATNHWARPTVTNRSGGVITKATLRKFLRDCQAPVAVTAPEVVDFFWEELFEADRRYVNDQAQVKYGYDGVKFQNTQLLGVPDGLQNSIDVIDFDDVFFATKGEISDPHGQGWYPLPRSTVRCRDFSFWGRLCASKSGKRNGRYYGFIMSSAITD